MSPFTYPDSFISFGNSMLLFCSGDPLTLLSFYIVLVDLTSPLYLQMWVQDGVWSSQLERNGDWYKEGHVTEVGSMKILPTTCVGTLEGKRSSVSPRKLGERKIKFID